MSSGRKHRSQPLPQTPHRSGSANIEQCERCPRLRAWCREVAHEKRAAFRTETYWGKPVPGWGDPQGPLWVVGLAPAAHGANRTGRMFTGDRSGEWLYRALFRAGFATQPLPHFQDHRKSDGLKLIGTWVTSVVKCAPPNNKPTPQEVATCSSTHLSLEWQEFASGSSSRKVVVALGSIALNGLWPLLDASTKKPKFGHGVERELTVGGSQILVICSYHPSQQNTFTGKLTEPRFDAIFSRAREWLLPVIF